MFYINFANMSFESHCSILKWGVVKFTQFSESSVDMESMTEDDGVIGR